MTEKAGCDQVRIGTSFPSKQLKSKRNRARFPMYAFFFGTSSQVEIVENNGHFGHLLSYETSVLSGMTDVSTNPVKKITKMDM